MDHGAAEVEVAREIRRRHAVDAVDERSDTERGAAGHLARGLNQPGGKLPLFDTDGREVAPETIRACIARGWAEPWFANPIKPDWIVAKLTAAGYRRLGVEPPATAG